MKRRFTGPVWGLVVLSLVFIGAHLNHLIIEYPILLYQMGMLNVFLAFILWPLLLWTEAFFYWRVRVRNVYRRQSWRHVILFVVFLSSPFLRDFLFWVYDDFGIKMDLASYLNIVDWSLGIAAWAAFLAGHVLFVRVLVMCYRKRRVAVETGESVNLLDDLLI